MSERDDSASSTEVQAPVDAAAVLAAMELPYVQGGDYESYSNFADRKPNPVETADAESQRSFDGEQRTALEAFKLAQAQARTAFLRKQKVARLGLGEDATDEDIKQKEKVVALARKAMETKATLGRFVKALREQKAGNWGYEGIVKGMFENRPNVGLNSNVDGDLPVEVKDKVIGEVLAETGLTKEEADGLVKAQSSNGEKERTNDAKNLFAKALQRVMAGQTADFEGQEAVNAVFGERKPADFDGEALVNVCGWWILPESAEQIRSEVLASNGLTEESLQRYRPKDTSNQ